MFGSFLKGMLSGERLLVSYLLVGNEKEAWLKAKDICYEQTVEYPEDLVPAGPIREEIVGRIERIVPVDGERCRALISYAVEIASSDILQLLNVAYGNISMKDGIKVESISLPERMLGGFPGPCLGENGMRALLDVPSRPFLCAAIKPLGSSPAELAEQAYQLASGGIDIIKDDHGLMDHSFCPFHERVARCVEAVARANARTQAKTIYVPNITAPSDRLLTVAHRAKELGAGGLLVCVGLIGLDSLRLLASDDSLGLPLIAHPSFLGSYVTSPYNGLSHGTLFGQLMRLLGADMAIFPNFGGRFGFSRGQCAQIAQACRESMGQIRRNLPTPGGGMTADNIKDLREVFGRHFVLLVGGGLHRRNGELAENVRYFVQLISTL